MNFPQKFFKTRQIVTVGAAFFLVSCSDTQRLKTELKHLNAQEVELNTEAGVVSAQVSAAKRDLNEVERAQARKPKVAEIEAQVTKLKARVEYLDAANKAVAEQNKVLLGDLAAYQSEFVQK